MDGDYHNFQYSSQSNLQVMQARQQQQQQQQQQLLQRQHHQQQPSHNLSDRSFQVANSIASMPHPISYSAASPFAFPRNSRQTQPSQSSLSSDSLAAALGIDPSAFSTDVAFQLPSFLSGPMATPGGGADILHGTDVSAFGQDFASWYPADSAPSKLDDFSMSVPSASKFSYSAPQSVVPASFRVPSSSPFDFPPSTASFPLSADPTELARRPSTSSHISAPTPPSTYHSPIVGLPSEAQVPTALLSNPFQSLSLPSNQIGLYSTTGFDMMGIIAKVINRPNPMINLGPVDFSCSFTVVDIRRFDSPIVYASKTFCDLTGYDAEDVVGKNCRFLQAPSGHVSRGAVRHYTDPAAVAHLRKSLAAQKECQASLINYRKGGQPFINLVSIVPISWGDSDDIAYHVGFQVDLVEQPNAILQEMQNGKYVFNYSALPPSLADDRFLRKEAGVSSEMRTMVEGLAARSLGTTHVTDDQVLQELHNLLLENSDDFIHVLSMKGNFLYVSPSVTRILEYTAEDLLGKSINDITHPADIVSVLRELKESSHVTPDDAQPQQQQHQQPQQSLQGQLPLHSTLPLSPKPVHLLLRVRRKHSGYMWLESTGRLYVENGKGRKAIVLTGRKREMPRLTWSTISRAGGLAERAFWAKASVDGHFLAVSSTVALESFGWSSEDMVGTSLLHEWVPDPSERETVKAALRSAVSSGASARVTCRMGRLTKGTISAVIICFFPYEDDAAAPAAPWGETRSPPRARRRQHELICQIMPLSTGNLVVRTSSTSPSSDESVFAELETARSTSFQYEFQQLRNDITGLKSEVQSRLDSRMQRRRQAQR